VIRLDENNRVTGLTYAWKDYAPPESKPFDAERWKHESDDVKILMASDFISRWNSGDLKEKYHHFTLIERDLGKVLFVDEWRYLIGDWEALILDFAPSGRVQSTEIGYDD